MIAVNLIKNFLRSKQVKVRRCLLKFATQYPLRLFEVCLSLNFYFFARGNHSRTRKAVESRCNHVIKLFKVRIKFYSLAPES